MAENAFVNKVIYGGNTIIDLTNDTVDGYKVINGTKFHLPTGELVETALAEEPASGSNPRKIVGIPIKSAQTYPPSRVDVTIPGGTYLNGDQKISKVVIGNLTAQNVKYGEQITVGSENIPGHLSDVTGTFTGDATMTSAELLNGAIGYALGQKITGSMTNNGSVTGTISTKTGQYTIPQGFHDGSGKVGISSTEQAKIIAGNIKSGITMLGVTGTYSGESITAQTKNVTPQVTAQTVSPDTGYDYLAQVNVAAIPYTETDNSAGGKTVTIG